MDKFLNLLLGTNDVPTYLASLVFALIGVVIILLVKSNKRNKHSTATPFKFDFWFLIQDNFREFVLGLLLILLALRFSVEYAGVDLTMWYALGIGLGFQKLSSWITRIEVNARK